MKRADINQLFRHLNEKLTFYGESRELVVCGGAALILSNYNKEETVDVDMLSPNKDILLDRIAREIASEVEGVREDWLNSHAASFFEKHNPLPKGWENRLVDIYKESYLKVKALSPDDLLFSKICSHIEREMDEGDIKELAKTKKIFERAVVEVLKLDNFQNTASEIIVDELRIRLGFNDEK